MSRTTFLAFTCAALAIGTLASNSASAGTRPAHLPSSAGVGFSSIHLPHAAAFNHFTGPATSVLGSGVVLGNVSVGSGAATGTKFGDVKLSGSKLGQSGAFKVIQAELPPGGIGTGTAGVGTTGTGTAGTSTGGTSTGGTSTAGSGTGTGTGIGTAGTATGTGGTGTAEMGNGGMGRGPRFPGAVMVGNSYPGAQYIRIHRDYGWYGRYPAAVAPVIAPVIAKPIIAAAPSCLSKEYLQQGVVLFRDICTKEWAINNTSSQTASNAACLTKANPRDGVVLFKDICSSEWAMNPAQPADQAQN